MAPTKKQNGRSNRTHQTSQQRASTTANSIAAQDRPGLGASLPEEFQQMILDVFRRAFPFHHDQLDLKATIQQIKGYLFQRDFSRAFAEPEYLDAYALRWSASRALGYSSVFLHDDLQQTWSAVEETARSAVTGISASTTSWEPSLPLPGEPHSHASACRAVCIGGGGGAEVAAFAAAARTLPSSTKLTVHVVDIADWSPCLQKLEDALCAPPQLSAYASESAKVANKAFIASDQFSVSFSQADILAVNEAGLRDMMQDVHICTIMFAMNELFSTSIARTTAFLLALTESMRSGSWLLVVDSPGSYSEVKLGKGEDAKTRQYPMKWLLDHTLLEVVGEGENSKWKKIVSDDSRWFRLHQQSLKYPIELENMRYQIHLYQRDEPAGS